MKIRWGSPILTVLTLSCAATFVLPAWGAGRPSSNEPDFVTGELIVLLAPADVGAPTPEEVVEQSRRGLPLPGGLGAGGARQARYGIAHRARGELLESLRADPTSPRAKLERYVVLSYPAGADLDRIELALGRNPHVLHVQRNLTYELAITPGDPLFPDRDPATGLPRPAEAHQWGSYILKLPTGPGSNPPPSAWDRTTGHAYVGVVDTGISTNHPDLRPFSGSDYVGGNFREHLSYDYHYGEPDVDEKKLQFVEETQSLETPTRGGHGTHVSGIIGATANNQLGVAGACWDCSLMIGKAARLRRSGGQFLLTSLPTSAIAAAITGLVDDGAQLINMSFGHTSNFPDCSDPNDELDIYCIALSYANDRDVVLVASSGNGGPNLDGEVEFPARDPRVIAAGGVIPGGGFWSTCDPSKDTSDCPSKFGPSQELVAPARQVLSTFYEGLPYLDVGCDDSWGAGGPGYGPCTGTSMSAPYVTGVAALLRSVNPLLLRAHVRDLLNTNASNGGVRSAQTGYGIPDATAAVEDALGKADGLINSNRLTPLFSLYSSVAEDHFYTTAPQMATAAIFNVARDRNGDGTIDPATLYAPRGLSVPGYADYPGGQCVVGPCFNATPTASVYVFTTGKPPFVGAPPLVPLYRLSYFGPTSTNPANRDHTYTTEEAGIEAFHATGYDLDGVEGYIYKKCTPEPACIPSGAVRLYRRYNAQRDDFAIFPESELALMANEGYTSAGGFAEVLGYVYPNLDSDGDFVIDGFEAMIGSDPLRGDSDCDDLMDGTEVLSYPYHDKDPLAPASGPGCIPPVARFTFSCAGLFCSFNGSGSTNDLGIVSYAWTFGDSTSGSGVTATRTYTSTGSFTVTLTVTDRHGLRSSKSRKVSVISNPPMAAEGFFTVPPCRIADTRTTAALSSAVQQTFQVTGLCGVPATAKAVSFNATVVSPTGPGHLVFLPGNQASGPFAHSTINFAPANSPRANNAILRLATNGAGTVRVHPFVAATPGQVHLILDVYGYFSEDSVPAPAAQGPLGFQTVAPCRIADTRTTAPIAAGTTRNFTVQGGCGIPVGAAAAALNLVVVGPTVGGHASLFRAGAFPPVPTINFNAGVVLANGARVRLAPTTPDLSLNYFSPTGTGSTHALVDVYGYFKWDAPLKYRPITACRAVDTRFADQGGPALGAAQLRSFQIRGNCGVPPSAKAAAVNITTVGAAGPGHLVVYPSGSPAPAASYLNFDSAQGALGNGGVVALSTLAEDLAVVSANGTHLIVDVFGYFE